MIKTYIFCLDWKWHWKYFSAYDITDGKTRL